MELEFPFYCDWLFRIRIILHFFSTSFSNFKLSPTNFLDCSSYQFPVVFTLFYRHLLYTYVHITVALILHYYFHQLTSIDTLAHLHMQSLVGLKIGYYWHPTNRLNHWATCPFSNMRKLTCAFDLLSDSACLKTANLSETLVSISCLYLNSSVRFNWCWLELKKREISWGYKFFFEISSKWIPTTTPEFSSSLLFTGLFTLSLVFGPSLTLLFPCQNLFPGHSRIVFDVLLEEGEKRNIPRTAWHFVIRR